MSTTKYNGEAAVYACVVAIAVAWSMRDPVAPTLHSAVGAFVFAIAVANFASYLDQRVNGAVAGVALVLGLQVLVNYLVRVGIPQSFRHRTKELPSSTKFTLAVILGLTLVWTAYCGQRFADSVYDFIVRHVTWKLFVDVLVYAIFAVSTNSTELLIHTKLRDFLVIPHARFVVQESLNTATTILAVVVYSMGHVSVLNTSLATVRDGFSVAGATFFAATLVATF